MMQKQNNQPSVEGSDSMTNVLTAAQIFDALRELEQQAWENPFDSEEAKRVSNALFEYYLKSAEAASFTDPLEGPRILVDLAADFQEVTIPALNSRQLEGLLFYIIPAQIAADPETAGNIIQTMRSLYVWLGRELALEQADEFIELLGDDATRELEQRMDDPDNYSQAKALTMEALAAGVDPSDKHAFNTFVRKRMYPRSGSGLAGLSGHAYADGLDPFQSASSPNLTPQQQRTQQKKRKTNRKAARKARKKNR